MTDQAPIKVSMAWCGATEPLREGPLPIGFDRKTYELQRFQARVRGDIIYGWYMADIYNIEVIYYI